MARFLRSLRFGKKQDDHSVQSHREHRSKRGRKKYKTFGMKPYPEQRNAKPNSEWKSNL